MPFHFFCFCFEFCEPFTVCQGHIAVHLTIVQNIRFAVFKVAEQPEQVDGAAYEHSRRQCPAGRAADIFRSCPAGRADPGFPADRIKG